MAMPTPTNILASALGLSHESRGLNTLARNAVVSTAPKGARLFASGDVCENFVIVIKGTAKVQLSTHTGREMILFRLEPGQSCALTTSCILTESPYYAEGIAETDLELMTLPANQFLEVLHNEPELFTILLSNYAQRIGELTGVVDRLLTRDLNVELKKLLLTKADSQNCCTAVSF
jgi:CRP/FNR family transcriptional regulator